MEHQTSELYTNFAKLNGIWKGSTNHSISEFLYIYGLLTKIEIISHILSHSFPHSIKYIAKLISKYHVKPPLFID